MFAQATFAHVEHQHTVLATTPVATLETTTPEFTLEAARQPEHRLFAVERALEAARVVAFARAFAVSH
jgi:hypothetical protein